MKQVAKSLKRYGCEILYEDDELIVLSKPAGLRVLPDRFDTTAPNLYHIFLSLYSSLFVVHRIDKETSGLLVFAKSAESHTALSRLFEQRNIEKRYYAFVEGTPRLPEETITFPLREVRGKVYVHPEGKEAVTHYRVLEQFRGFAFLEVTPLTGRLHQIRAHLKAVGLPILCDGVYGTGSPLFLSSLKHFYRGKEHERPLITRTALHAFSLSFEHPANHRQLCFESPLPRDMASTLQVLRKYAAIPSLNK